MAAEIPFEGFKVDQGHALAIADALAGTLATIERGDARTAEVLAALGIQAARTILASKLRLAPQTAAAALEAYILAWVAALGQSGQPA